MKIEAAACSRLLKYAGSKPVPSQMHINVHSLKGTGSNCIFSNIFHFQPAPQILQQTAFVVLIRSLIFFFLKVLVLNSTICSIS